MEEAVSGDHYQQKHGLFSVVDGKQMKEMLRSLNITGLTTVSRVVASRLK